MDKTIAIRCEAAGFEDFHLIEDLQGKLKKISREDLDKLKGLIVSKGIIAPSFVWRKPGGGLAYLDGHQRHKAYTELEKDGFLVPLIPVVYIQADTFEDAKEKLLAVTSQFGSFDLEGMDDFMAGLDVEKIIREIRLVDTPIDFDLEEATTGSIDLPALEGKKAEVEFAEELREEHNYVVLYFDNEVDWLQAQTLFDIKSVQSLDSKPGFRRIGVGRVLRGSKALETLRKRIQESL